MSYQAGNYHQSSLPRVLTQVVSSGQREDGFCMDEAIASSLPSTVLSYIEIRCKEVAHRYPYSLSGCRQFCEKTYVSSVIIDMDLNGREIDFLLYKFVDQIFELSPLLVRNLEFHLCKRDGIVNFGYTVSLILHRIDEEHPLFLC